MNWPWPPQRGDVMGVLLALAIVGLVIFAFTHYGQVGWRVNRGFGSDWDCTDVGKGDPVCIKKAPAPNNKAN